MKFFVMILLCLEYSNSLNGRLKNEFKKLISGDFKKIINELVEDNQPGQKSSQSSQTKDSSSNQLIDVFLQFFQSFGQKNQAPNKIEGVLEKLIAQSNQQQILSGKTNTHIDVLRSVV